MTTTEFRYEAPAAPTPPPVPSFDPNEDPVVIGAFAHVGLGGPSNPTAGRPGNVAIGFSATVHDVIGFGGDFRAVAIGYGADVAARWGVAIGYGASAVDSSVAIGKTAVAAYQAIAIGQETAANFQNGIAIGTLSVSDALYAIAVSGHCWPAAASALAIFGDAFDLEQLVLGVRAGAGVGAYRAVAIGSNAFATIPEQIMLGRPNNAQGAGDPGSFVEIPGRGVKNGIVFTDTVSGVRQLLRLTGGALTLTAAPT